MARQDDNAMMAEQIEDLDLDELCSICHVTPDFVMELIEYGAIEPKDSSLAKHAWHFDAREVRIVHTAVRLHYDLDVNHAGIALAVDLLKQIEEMREQLGLLEKYFVAIHVKD